MLTTTKSVSLTGQSTVEGTQVIYLSANVTTDNAGNTSINQSIQNQELYRANRIECRKDIEAFQEQVWEIEDGMLEELAAKK